jgi:hypothetical protein
VSEPDLRAFVQDFAVREAIYALTTETREPVNLAQVIGRVRQRHPEVRLSTPELKQKVIGVANEAATSDRRSVWLNQLVDRCCCIDASKAVSTFSS